MALIYQGKGEFINDSIVGHIPARDLSDEEVRGIQAKWGISLAETEGLLMKRGLYAMPPKLSTKKTEESKGE